MADYALLNQQLFEGRHEVVRQGVEEALAEGRPALEVLEEGLIAGMRVVGEDFRHNRVFVPEVLLAARAMKAGLAVLKPLLGTKDAGPASSATVVLGTVKGDLHDIGKNLVAMMLKGAGYEVDDLGVDCDVAKFQAAVDRGAQAVLCSALLTTTMPYMKTVADALKDKGAKVVVGGAPVTQQYANEIGAAGYGADANDAVKVIDQLLGVRT